MLAPLVSREGYFLPLEPPVLTPMRERACLSYTCSIFRDIVEINHSVFFNLDVDATYNSTTFLPTDSTSPHQLISLPGYCLERHKDENYRKDVLVSIYDIFCHFIRQCYPGHLEAIEICDDLILSSAGIDQKSSTQVLAFRDKWKDRWATSIQPMVDAILEHPSFMLCAIKEDPLYHLPRDVLCDPRFFIGQQRIGTWKVRAAMPHTILTIHRLAYFAGLTCKFLGEKICSGSARSSMEELSCGEVQALLLSMKEVEKLEEISTAFERTCNLKFSCRRDIEAILEAIQTGQLFFLPIQYEFPEGSHLIVLVFYQNRFAFCSRGHKPIGRREVECFTYNPSLLTVEILTEILIYEKKDDLTTIGQQSDYVEERFYTYLPTQVKAESFAVHRFIKFKPQYRASNCAKTSSLTAFKFSVFLKALGEGKSEKEAGRIAKHIGHIVSHYIRVSLENKVKEVNASYHIKELEDVLRESAEKTARKGAKIAQITARQEPACVVS